MLQPGPGSRAISGRTSRCRSDSWDSPAPAGARSSFGASCATSLGGGLAAGADIGAVPIRMVLTAIMGSLLRPRAIRLAVAKEENRLAFRVFSTSTLQEMAAFQPTSLDGLMDVWGVDGAKDKRYGRRFLDVIVGEMD